MEEGDLPSGHIYVSEIVKEASCTQDGEPGIINARNADLNIQVSFRKPGIVI